MNKLKLFSFATLIFIVACKININSHTSKTEASLLAKPVNIIANKTTATYQPTKSRRVDILHTQLKISFDYQKQHAFGKATLLFKPYFYETNIAIIDAKGMILNRVTLIKKADTIDLKYTYDSLQIKIELDKTYTLKDTFKIFIDYVSRPNELNFKGSEAIRDAKGLYFINPLLKEVNKPRQIWTQGETESNSCWMPTIDAPNEKHTQELFITAQNNEVTLSNGKLISVTNNKNGTHTDYWFQSLPHAPYLTMMAIGEFTVTKEIWHDSVEVSYYLEKGYEKYANLIFGPTKEMLDCFSKKLGVDYPWEKFSQIVVRDFVSGAMENTGAVLHGEFVQHDNREHLDNDQEDIIAHEMFHHWFGDLTTAESWSNLPLNESFATYGEYIWNEWKHGNMEADAVFYRNLNGYLQSKSSALKIPIRYHYHNKEDMFDAVSYSKGGRILHMLRKQIGDEAFFKSLQLYLTKNRFKSAEIHDLRLAFEETTGLDLNVFFNQWFLKFGHPELELSIKYENGMATLKVVQKQDSAVFGLYELPVYVNVLSKKGKKSSQILITKKEETFTFNADSVYLVVFDPEKSLVAKTNQFQNNENWFLQFNISETWGAKHEAIEGLAANYNQNKAGLSKEFKNIILNSLLPTNHHRIIELGMNAINGLAMKDQMIFEESILKLCSFENKASVRANALLILYNWNQVKYKTFFVNALSDSSNQVVANALYGLSNLDSNGALIAANKWRNYSNFTISQAVSSVISKFSKQNENQYFEHTILNKPYGKRNFMYLYAKYLISSKNETKREALKVFERLYEVLEGEEKKYLVYNAVNDIKESLLAKRNEQKSVLGKNKENESLRAEFLALEELILSYEQFINNKAKN